MTRKRAAAPRAGPVGRFGKYGGRYVPETLIAALEQLARVYDAASKDPAFRTGLDHLLRTYAGRPTPLSDAPRLSERAGCRVLLKRGITVGIPVCIKRQSHFVIGRLSMWTRRRRTEGG